MQILLHMKPSNVLRNMKPHPKLNPIESILSCFFFHLIKHGVIKKKYQTENQKPKERQRRLA